MIDHVITTNLIDGAWVQAENNAVITVKNPFDGSVLDAVPDMQRQQVEQAIVAAKKAQGGWAAMTAYERAAILQRWAKLIDDHNERLAQIMVAECGKTIREARIEAKGNNIVWAAEEALHASGRIIPSNQKNRQIQLIKQPVGVAGLITPWNFPAAMITRKVGSALAAGCAVVLKPDHRTPFIALAMAELAQQAGLSNGVLNVITGDAAMIGEIFCTHPDVRKVSFTGSTRVGKILMQQCAPHLKKLSLELGGNAPFIVFPSANIDDAVNTAMTAKFRNSGQSCVSGNRFYIHDSLHDTFVEKVLVKIKALKIADGINEDSDIGSLIDANAVAKVDELVQEAIKAGARCLTGGKQSSVGKYFYDPTLLTGVTSDMRISREEIFGPVMAVQKFNDEAAVLQLANDSIYGLASYIVTNDLSQANRVAAALDFGMVGVNNGMMSFAATPFGGTKQSGQGREGGAEGLDAFLEIKTITLQF